MALACYYEKQRTKAYTFIWKKRNIIFFSFLILLGVLMLSFFYHQILGFLGIVQKIKNKIIITIAERYI